MVRMIFFLSVSLFLAGCAGVSALVSKAFPTQGEAAQECPIVEPAWIRPPDDPAVMNEPAYGYYYHNEDQSILAGAWWAEGEDFPLRAGENGNKVGWFRPDGADLEITGRRIDGDAPPMKAEVPCCYPTRFQATGLYFPTAGCWEITAKAGGRSLTFVVLVEEEK